MLTFKNREAIGCKDIEIRKSDFFWKSFLDVEREWVAVSGFVSLMIIVSKSIPKIKEIGIKRGEN